MKVVDDKTLKGSINYVIGKGKEGYDGIDDDYVRSSYNKACRDIARAVVWGQHDDLGLVRLCDTEPEKSREAYEGALATLSIGDTIDTMTPTELIQHERTVAWGFITYGTGTDTHESLNRHLSSDKDKINKRKPI